MICINLLRHNWRHYTEERKGKKTTNANDTISLCHSLVDAREHENDLRHLACIRCDAMRRWWSETRSKTFLFQPYFLMFFFLFCRLRLVFFFWRKVKWKIVLLTGFVTLFLCFCCYNHSALSESRLESKIKKSRRVGECGMSQLYNLQHCRQWRRHFVW